jgi:hypothetical protein
MNTLIKQEAERRNPIKAGDENISVTISFERMMRSFRIEFEAGASYAQSLQRPGWVKWDESCFYVNSPAWIELRELWNSKTTIPKYERMMKSLEQFILGYKEGYLAAKNISESTEGGSDGSEAVGLRNG